MNIHTLAQATLAARKATSAHICTRASKGQVQAGYMLGDKFIDISEWMSVEAMTRWMHGFALGHQHRQTHH